MNDNISKINQLFQVLKIKARVESIREGLRTCEYLIKLEIGERVSKIKALSEELSLIINSLSSPKIKLNTATGHVIIETTTTTDAITITLSSIINQVNPKYNLPLALGKDMYNRPFSIDLADSPHLLIGGTTGSGKSILTKTILYSLANKHASADLQFILIDPKGTELVDFKNSNYCLTHITTAEKAAELFDVLVGEMERRFKILSKHGKNDIKSLEGEDKLPFVVVIIDELADLLMQDKKKFIYERLVRILQKARAAGIHVVANTQRPSKDIVSGLIKSNMPVQIALRTANNYDSRTIIGEDGAEKLVGKGDMLVRHNGKITRIQGAYV